MPYKEMNFLSKNIYLLGKYYLQIICIVFESGLIMELTRKLDDVENKRKCGSWDIYKKQINQKPTPVYFIYISKLYL